MEKEKIILNDGTEIEIENGAAENRVQIAIQNIEQFPELFNKFTEENLELYKIQNSEGLTCATMKNKYLEYTEVKQRESDILVSMYITDVDMVKKRLDALEIKTEVQDGAISDLGEAVSGLAEEGGLV